MSSSHHQGGKYGSVSKKQQYAAKSAYKAGGGSKSTSILQSESKKTPIPGVGVTPKEPEMLAEIKLTTYDADGKPITTKVTARSSKEHFGELIDLMKPAVSSTSTPARSTLVSSKTHSIKSSEPDKKGLKDLNKQPTIPKSVDKKSAISTVPTSPKASSGPPQSPKTPTKLVDKNLGAKPAESSKIMPLPQRSPKPSKSLPPVQSPKTPKQFNAIDTSTPNSTAKDFARKNSWSKLKGDPANVASPSQNNTKPSELNVSRDQVLPSNTPVKTTESPDKSQGNDQPSTSMWVSSQLSPVQESVITTLKTDEDSSLKVKSASFSDAPYGQVWVDEMEEFFTSETWPEHRDTEVKPPPVVTLDDSIGNLDKYLVKLNSATDLPETPTKGECCKDFYGHTKFKPRSSANIKVQDLLLEPKEVDPELGTVQIKPEKEAKVEERRGAIKDFKSSRSGEIMPNVEKLTPTTPRSLKSTKSPQTCEPLTPLTTVTPIVLKTPPRKPVSAVVAAKSPKALVCQSAKAKTPQSELYFQFPSPAKEPAFYNLNEDPDSVFDQSASLTYAQPDCTTTSQESSMQDRKHFGTQTIDVKKVDFASQTDVRYEDKPNQYTQTSRCLFNRRVRSHTGRARRPDRKAKYTDSMSCKSSERSADSNFDESDDGVNVTLDLANYKKAQSNKANRFNTNYIVDSPFARRNQIKKISQMQYSLPEESRTNEIKSQSSSGESGRQMPPSKSNKSLAKALAQKPPIDADSAGKLIVSRLRDVRSSIKNINTTLPHRKTHSRADEESWRIRNVDSNEPIESTNYYEAKHQPQSPPTYQPRSVLISEQTEINSANQMDEVYINAPLEQNVSEELTKSPPPFKSPLSSPNTVIETPREPTTPEEATKSSPPLRSPPSSPKTPRDQEDSIKSPPPSKSPLSSPKKVIDVPKSPKSPKTVEKTQTTVVVANTDVIDANKPNPKPASSPVLPKKKNKKNKIQNNYLFSNYGLDVEEEASSLPPNIPTQPIKPSKKQSKSKNQKNPPTHQAKSVLTSEETATANKMDQDYINAPQVYKNAEEAYTNDVKEIDQQIEKQPSTDVPYQGSMSRATSEGFVTALESANVSIEECEKKDVSMRSSMSSASSSIYSQGHVKFMVKAFNELSSVKSDIGSKSSIVKLQTGSKSLPIFNKDCEVSVEVSAQLINKSKLPDFDIDQCTLIASPSVSLSINENKK